MAGETGEDCAFGHAAAFGLETARERLRGAAALIVAGLPALEAEAHRFLSPSEALLLTDRLHPRRRHSLLAGRFAAKSALRALLPSLDATKAAILPGIFDQPVMSGEGLGNLQVTLSHCPPVAVALAFPEACPMGVDIEVVSGSNRNALSSQVGPSELALASKAFPGGSRDMLLTRLWCLKEALSKALRCGLTVPFDLLALSALTAEGAAEFSHFAQYGGISLASGRLAMAVVLPRNLRCGFDDDMTGDEPWAGWLAAAAAAFERLGVEGSMGGVSA